jgi:cytosine/adenosine deaminase-related metal-dependent hydrolase
MLLPGLINSHDHLEFGTFPRLGRGGYQNSAEWAKDIQLRDAAIIDAHRRIPKPARCWWGAIRNLLSGVTTVCHHNPLWPELLDPEFPVQVLRDFEWAHSLVFDPGLSEKFATADPERPFILHAAEGIDAESAKEVSELDRRGLLKPHTVLIHALALNEEAISVVNRSGAAVVWCPASNKFLFGRTHDSQVVASIDHLALGSDSSLTSCGGLLDDIAIARKAGIVADQLHNMIYATPVRLFGMNRGEGSIRAGGVADLIAVEDAGADPADTLSHLEPSRIVLVVVRGRAQLVRNTIRDRLPEELTEGLEPLEVGGEIVWLRAPLAQLFRAATDVIPGPLMLGEWQVRYAAGN